jgi:DNA-binding winged helix-turn-helix (wHTH) protein/predicted ATPase
LFVANGLRAVIYRFGTFHVDTDTFSLRRNDVAMRIDPQEFDVLVYLIEHRDRVVTRDELFASLWKGKVVSDSALSSRLRAIRRALDDSGAAQRVIQTVHGRGYRFIAPLAAEPVEARAERAATTTSRSPNNSARSVPPTVVGRDAEFDKLSALLERALGGAATFVFVAGESGVGKTTLVTAFANGQCETVRARVLRGHCSSEVDVTEPYLPLIDALRAATRSPFANDVDRVLRTRAPSWLARWPQWFGDAQVTSNVVAGPRLSMELTDALAALADDAPVVLVLEDFQWADPSTLDWVDYATRRAPIARLLVIGTLRTGVGTEAQRRIRELWVRDLAERIELGPLDAAAVGAYLEARLGRAADAATIDALGSYCAGQPLFMRVTVDSWLTETAGEVPLIEHLRTIPRSLRELVETGLDRLDPSVVDLLEAGSIAGAEFGAPHVAAVLATSEDEVEADLMRVSREYGFPLIGGELAWPDGTVSTAFRFSHQFFAQATYDRQGAGQRRRRHATIARRLVVGYGHRIAEHSSEVATHFERAGVRVDAIKYYELAARHHAERTSPREAAMLARRAVALLHELPESAERDEREIDLLTLLGVALSATEGYAAHETRRAYVDAHRLCKRLGEGTRLLPVLYGLCGNSIVGGSMAEALALGQDFVSLARAHADPAETVAVRQIAWPEFLMGRFDDAYNGFTEALELATPDRRGAALAAYGEMPDVAALAPMAMISWFLGRPARATTTVDTALRLASAANHSLSIAYALTAQQFLLQYEGDSAATLAAAQRSIDNAERYGLSLFGAWGRIMLGWARAAAGESAAGIAQMEYGVDEATALGASLFQTYFACLLSERLHEAGRDRDAHIWLDRASALATRTGERYLAAEICRLRGQVALTRDVESAFVEFDRAVETARAQGSPMLELRALTSWARAERSVGASGRGAETLRARLASLGAAEASATLTDARRALNPGKRARLR